MRSLSTFFISLFIFIFCCFCIFFFTFTGRLQFCRYVLLPLFTFTLKPHSTQLPVHRPLQPAIEENEKKKRCITVKKYATDITTVNSMSLALPRLHTLCVLSNSFVNFLAAVATTTTQIALGPEHNKNK